MPHRSVEEIRLRQLAELAILDTPLDPLMDKVCAIAAAALNVPMAYVSLIDATHQRLIGRYGLDLACTARKDAICNLTIQGIEPLIFEDTLADARTKHNRFVTEEPRIRFYAGIPLAIEAGVSLGAFCIAGTCPRTVDAEEIRLLESFADLVRGQIQYHMDKKELARRTLEVAEKTAILSHAEHLAFLGGFEADPRTGHMQWSDGLRRIFGFAKDTEATSDNLLSIFPRHVSEQLRERFVRVADDDREIDIETDIRAGSRANRHVKIRAIGCGVGEARRIIGIVQDVTERHLALADLEWTATHDDLTRLINRPALVQRIDAAVRDTFAKGRRVALVTLDIDGFRTLNDTRGPAVGDALLIAVSKRLQDVVGSRGAVGRIGGDEFAILINAFETEGAIASLATGILLALREPIAIEDTFLEARATLGISVQTASTSCGADLLKEADIALTHARQSGRDSFMFYRQAMREALEARAERLAAARAAIFAGQLEPWYQPKISLTTNQVVGFEALMRWHHPSLGICGPDAMGDVFADPEIAVAVGRGMLYRVAGDMVEWRRIGLAFGHIAVNVAAPEFYAGDYADRVFTCLASHHLEPSALEIEVTESVFLGQSSDNVARTLRKLAEGGVAIALDDFGTGYASLTHLKRYPVNFIKIDRSFVSDLEADPDAATIVDAVTSLAHSLGIGVVAEGIETPAQLAFLKARRCAVGQGFFFAKAMPASRVPYFLRGWAARQAAPRQLVRA